MIQTALLSPFDLGKGARQRELRVRVARLEEVLREYAPHCDARQIEEDLEHLVLPIIAMREAGQVQREQDLLRLFIGDAAPRRVDILRAKMKAEARKKVFDGAEWMTAAQIADVAGLGQKNPSGTVNRWKQQRHIFAINFDGQDWYPKYALGDDFRPWPAIARIMATFKDWTGERLASWFEAKSSTLGGERPRDVIQADPQRVIDAAERVASAETHNG